MVAAAETDAAALLGSSAAADIPSGKPSEAPAPHSAMPTNATGRFGARMKTMRPAPAAIERMRSVHTRPMRSTMGPPIIRNTVIETEKTVSAIAPVASVSRWPSTTAIVSQSLALPSAKAIPRMIAPIA